MNAEDCAEKKAVPKPTDWRGEIRTMLKIAWPIVLTQVGMMGMGLVDTLMVGPLGAVALAGVAIGNTVHMTVQLFLMGVIMGAEPLISRAFGAGKREECGRALWQALWISVIAGLPMSLLFLRPEWILTLLGQKPEVVAAGAEYISARSFGVLGFLLFASNRFFLNAVGNPRAVLYVALVANVVNAGLDYWFIYGGWFIKPLGPFGVGLATSLCTIVMAITAGIQVFSKRYRGFGLEPVGIRIDQVKSILSIGIPIGFQIGAEMGVFAMTALMIGWIGTVPVAAHQIAITLASFTFMVPLGISVAASVRVGHCLGAKDLDAAARAGRMAISLAVGFMSLTAAVFLLVPETLVSWFKTEPAVAMAGVELIRIAGFFQISDGMQVAGAGCLRGVQDTKVAAVLNIVAHWGIGLPLGYVLAFHYDMGARGLWIGLTASLTIVGVLLVHRFLRGSWRKREGSATS